MTGIILLSSTSQFCLINMSLLMTKPTKWDVGPPKTDQTGHPPILIRVLAVHMKKPWVLSYPLSAQRRLWSDWADAQADLSLRWAHSHFVGFVMRRLISWKWDRHSRQWNLFFWLMYLDTCTVLFVLRKTKNHVIYLVEKLSELYSSCTNKTVLSRKSFMKIKPYDLSHKFGRFYEASAWPSD